ncbi:MAG: FKBP-type peptidyl-prolyl cis-trans isomerase [Spirulina sp. SIO3F2]|nr:FKBP-type peptidyl-prolyl cis-trans isomerase [Spirulina sp. SIO3F2]
MRSIWWALIGAGLLLGSCASTAEKASTSEAETPKTEAAAGAESADEKAEDSNVKDEDEDTAAGETITTDSGLQYVDLRVGDGETPETGALIEVDYHGTLEDGTVFDSSYDRGEPLQFQIGVGQVIPGWDEGVGSMQVGGKRKLIIPSDLAYGPNQVGPIPPNSTLIFEVELLKIVE